MTLNEIMQPFVVFFDWLRNTTFYLGEYPFTFWDLIVWQMFAGIVIYWLCKIMFGD